MVSKNFFSALDDSEDDGDTSKEFLDEKKEVINEVANVISLDHYDKLSSSEGQSMNERRSRKKHAHNTSTGHRQPSQTQEGSSHYYRRSGAGRSYEVNKGGSVPQNCGSDKYNVRKTEGNLSELQKNDGKVNGVDACTNKLSVGDHKLDDNNTKERGTATPKEECGKGVPKEEDKTMTLAEFLKSKTNPESESFKPKEIKVVDNEFIGKTARITVKEDVLIMGKEKNLRKKSNKKLEKLTLDVGFPNTKSMNSNRRNRERGRSGGYQGDRDRGDRNSGEEWSGRGGNMVPEKTVNVMDPSSFPSL